MGEKIYSVVQTQILSKSHFFMPNIKQNILQNCSLSQLCCCDKKRGSGWNKQETNAANGGESWADNTHVIDVPLPRLGCLRGKQNEPDMVDGTKLRYLVQF